MYTLEGEPWNFANHVLLLKPWEPNIPPHCYDFSNGAFWVHIYRLPVEQHNEKVIRRIAGDVSQVVEVRV